MDLKQLNKFIKQVNQIHCCATPGCKGALCPIHVKSLRLGGALSITYACNGCASQWALFETSSKYELGCATEVGIAAQVAFIIAGCTHVTYYKVLKHGLGIEGVSWPMFDSTIKRMYPIVKEMVDKMRSDAKDDMQRMDQNELGSWSRAVTSADGTWMTRGHHSKNATFSIRNYYNGALLYRKHLCQKGRDDIIEEELYQGTSRASDNNDVISYSEDTLSDAESISLEKSVPTPTGDTSWCFEDDVLSGICVCGALGRAHKRDCPSNSRNRNVGCTLFPKASSADSDKNGKDDACVKSKPPKASKPVDTRSTRRGKRESQEVRSLPQRKGLGPTSRWVTA